MAAAPPSQSPLNSRRSICDLAVLTDEDSVVKALRNILSTQECMRPLRPDIDADVEGFLFEPLTEAKGFFLAQRLAKRIPVYEPRVKVESAKVTMNTEDKSYAVELKVSIPSIGRTLTVGHVYTAGGLA